MACPGTADGLHRLGRVLQSATLKWCRGFSAMTAARAQGGACQLNLRHGERGDALQSTVQSSRNRVTGMTFRLAPKTPSRGRKHGFLRQFVPKITRAAHPD